MAKHKGSSDGDNVSHPVPPENQAHHAAPDKPLVSDEQLAKDVAMFDRFNDESDGK